MPNHVTTHLVGPLELLGHLTRKRTTEELRDHDRAEEQRRQNFIERGMAHRFTRRSLDPEELIIDFNLVIPQPDNIERGDCDRVHQDGEICWYTWNMDNWGTKWNGYDFEVITVSELANETLINQLVAGEDTGEGIQVAISFTTAWAHPSPVVAALSRKLGNVTIGVEYADEDLGFNLGAYLIRNGEVTARLFEEKDTEAARDFATKIKYRLATYAMLQEEFED